MSRDPSEVLFTPDGSHACLLRCSFWGSWLKASHFRRSSTGFKYVVRNAGADLLLPADLLLSRSVLVARLSAVSDRVLGRESN